jgi:hypothetical protein
MTAWLRMDPWAIAEVFLVLMSLRGLESKYALGCPGDLVLWGWTYSRDPAISTAICISAWWLFHISHTFRRFVDYVASYPKLTMSVFIDFAVDHTNSSLMVRLWILVIASMQLFFMNMPNTLGGCKSMIPLVIACLHVVLMFTEFTSKHHEA